MASCKFCGETISWKTVSGRWVPHNPDGSGRHTCLAKSTRADIAASGMVEIKKVPPSPYVPSIPESAPVALPPDSTEGIVFNMVKTMLDQQLDHYKHITKTLNKCLGDIYLAGNDEDREMAIEYLRRETEFWCMDPDSDDTPAVMRMIMASVSRKIRASAKASSAESPQPEPDDPPPAPPEKPVPKPKKRAVAKPPADDIPPPPSEGKEEYRMTDEEIRKIMARKEEILAKTPLAPPIPPPPDDVPLPEDEPKPGV